MACSMPRPLSPDDWNESGSDTPAARHPKRRKEARHSFVGFAEPATWLYARNDGNPSRDSNVRFYPLALFKNRKIDRVSHDLVPRVIGMHVVTAVVRREQPRRVSWIARNEIEVQHVIEFAARSDEGV